MKKETFDKINNTFGRAIKRLGEDRPPEDQEWVTDKTIDCTCDCHQEKLLSCSKCLCLTKIIESTGYLYVHKLECAVNKNSGQGDCTCAKPCTPVEAKQECKCGRHELLNIVHSTEAQCYLRYRPLPTEDREFIEQANTCQHDEISYLSNPPKLKCKNCGTFLVPRLQ